MNISLVPKLLIGELSGNYTFNLPKILMTGNEGHINIPFPIRRLETRINIRLREIPNIFEALVGV